MAFAFAFLFPSLALAFAFAFLFPSFAFAFAVLFPSLALLVFSVDAMFFFLVTRLLSFLNSVCSSLSLFLLATVPLPFPIGNAQFSLDSRFASQSRFKCVCIYQCGFSFLFLYLLVSSVDAIFQYVLVISINALFPI